MRRSLRQRPRSAPIRSATTRTARFAGIVHRYPDRVLLKLTHVCAVYCRFCFRREMVGPGAEPLTAKQLDAALDYIAAHPGIWEVILTGGDPLVLSPRRIKSVMSRLAAIEHVKIVRVHTRVPVADPDRITREMVRALKLKGKATYVVLHANHARELTDAAREACARMIDAGIPMLSQSVLLAGVNDDAQTLGALMRALVENRIKPYYLHHGDLAPGTSHLRTSIEQGQELMRALRGRLSGLCQPELRARHSRRPRQVADRPELSLAGRRRRHAGRGLQRSIALLSADDVIRLLDLKPHPEGGHYRETFRDVPTRESSRAASTAIYFLLKRGERSHWHRVDAAEVWHWHAGSPLKLRINSGGATKTLRLGPDLAAGERPQAVVPAYAWQAAESNRRLDAGRLHGRAGLPVREIRAGATGLGAGLNPVHCGVPVTGRRNPPVQHGRVERRQRFYAVSVLVAQSCCVPFRDRAGCRRHSALAAERPSRARRLRATLGSGGSRRHSRVHHDHH